SKKVSRLRAADAPSTSAIQIRSGALKRLKLRETVGKGPLTVSPDTLLLGVDGGGTRCRARLCSTAGIPIREGATGPANLRPGLEQTLSAVLEAGDECLDRAGLPPRDLGRVVACVALAGASEPTHLVAAQGYQHPFRKAVVTTDAHAACVGAHQGH